MSLEKVPIIVLLTLGFKKMLTNPNPTPSSEEMVPTTQIDMIGVRKHRHTVGHIVQIIVAAAEIIAITAPKLPPSPLKNMALSLAFSTTKHPSNLRLTNASSLGAALWLLGAALRLRTYHDLGSFFRYDISIQKDHRLITTGPYSIVRHPAYSGMLLANIGWFLWNFSEGSWVRESGLLNRKVGIAVLMAYISFIILPTSAVTLSRMSNEDAALRKKFGAKWDEWAGRVPYSVLPGIY